MVVGLLGMVIISVWLWMFVVWCDRMVVGILCRLVWCIFLLKSGSFFFMILVSVLGVLLCGVGLVLLVIRIRLLLLYSLCSVVVMLLCLLGMIMCVILICEVMVVCSYVLVFGLFLFLYLFWLVWLEMVMMVMCVVMMVLMKKVVRIVCGCLVYLVMWVLCVVISFRCSVFSLMKFVVFF